MGEGEGGRERERERERKREKVEGGREMCMVRIIARVSHSKHLVATERPRRRVHCVAPAYFPYTT